MYMCVCVIYNILLFNFDAIDGTSLISFIVRKHTFLVLVISLYADRH